MPLDYGSCSSVHKMQSSKLLYPLSDHLLHLLIAQSSAAAQILRNQATVPQKQTNSSMSSALAMEDQSLCSEEETETDLYSSDEFRMFEFKIRRCTRSRSHDWTECPFAHPGEKARRRDPRRFHYSGTACADFRKGSCRKGDACELSHGVFESWLHPARYRTQPCKDGPNCLRRVCFFAHSAHELRVLAVPTLKSAPSLGLASDFHQHCSVCADSKAHSTSPVSTLISLPESPPSLSPPLSPNSLKYPPISSSDHSITCFFSPPSSPCGSFAPPRSLAMAELYTQSKSSSPCKLVRSLTISSADHSPPPSSPSAGSLGSPRSLAMVDLYSQSLSSSPLRHATQVSFIKEDLMIPMWRKDVDPNSVLRIGEEHGTSMSYGAMKIGGNAAGNSISKPMQPFKRGGSFPDLEWVDELVGYE